MFQKPKDIYGNQNRDTDIAYFHEMAATPVQMRSYEQVNNISWLRGGDKHETSVCSLNTEERQVTRDINDTLTAAKRRQQENSSYYQSVEVSRLGHSNIPTVPDLPTTHRTSKLYQGVDTKSEQ